jgi:hypothetical protein
MRKPPPRKPPARRRRCRRLPTAMPAPRKSKGRWRRVYRRVRRIGGWLLGTPLAAVGFVYAVWGPVWPLPLEFAPGEPSFGSAFDVPFTVSNKSALFGFSNVSIACELRNFKAVGPTGSAITQSPTATGTVAPQGTNPTIARLTTTTFTCPIGRAFMIDNRNAGEQLVSASISFVVEYDARLWWGRAKVKIGPFSFDPRTVPGRWVPGEPLK